jgi:hypothetical protein
MIDVEQAREKITNDWLPVCEVAAGGPVRIADEDTTEYEWGWVFYCEGIASSGEVEKANYYATFLVDRLTGTVLRSVNGGIIFSVARLMELRQEHPPATE